jgi:hypothetical protein
VCLTERGVATANPANGLAARARDSRQSPVVRSGSGLALFKPTNRNPNAVIVFYIIAALHPPASRPHFGRCLVIGRSKAVPVVARHGDTPRHAGHIISGQVVRNQRPISERSRRIIRASIWSATASADRRPCFQALRLPRGAPGFVPPCIRQRPFGIRRDRHGWPARVFAPHCMGLFGVILFTHPLPCSRFRRLRLGRQRSHGRARQPVCRRVDAFQALRAAP